MNAGPAAVVRWAIPVAIAAITVWSFRAMLGQPLLSDDFGLIVGNRELGLDGFLRFLVFADYGEQQWMYWRPGWVLLFWLVHTAFGAEPFAWKCTALALHVGSVLLLYTIARRATGSLVVAAAAALLLALHPGHGEAVLWVAAAFNVLPAAMLLLAAAWCTWRAAANGGTRLLVAGWSLAAASFLWKEAAYGFPVVMFTAWLVGRKRGAWRRSDTVFAAATTAFAMLVVAHYLGRNKATGFAGSAGDMLQVMAASLAMFVRQLVAVPGGNVVVAAGAVTVALVLFVVLRGQVRFWLVATAAGTLPYVFLAGSGRFAYFVHVPLCLLLATGVASALRASASRRREWVAAGFVLLPLALAPGSLRAEIERFGADAALADRVLTALVADGHAVSDRLVVDVVPECLMNGFEPALALRTGRDMRVSSLQAVPRPPFLIHIHAGDPPLSRDSTILHFDPAAQRYVARPFGDLLGGLVPTPLLALCHRFRVVAGEAEARALLAAGDAPPAVSPLLYEAPGVAIDPAGTGEITAPRTDIRDMGATVTCTAASLLVIAFPVPVDFRSPPGAIWIDGVPVPVLVANILFHAVVVPPGTHDVRLIPAFGR